MLGKMLTTGIKETNYTTAEQLKGSSGEASLFPEPELRNSPMKEVEGGIRSQPFVRQLNAILNQPKEVNKENDEVTSGLTDAEKNKIKQETGWSNEIVNAIGSMEEYEIYKKAGLREVEIGGKKCLIRNDIDWDKKRETGKFDQDGNPIYETNSERIEKGKAPLDKDGNPIQLHHIGQHAKSPLAELTFEEHRCNGNDVILHDKNRETETHGEGNTWDSERQEYWKNRAEYNNGGNKNV